MQTEETQKDYDDKKGCKYTTFKSDGDMWAVTVRSQTPESRSRTIKYSGIDPTAQGAIYKTETEASLAMQRYLDGRSLEQ